MKVRDYETELLEIEKAYNDEQALIKQCTEKLFEDMKEPMDFFIRKNFITGRDYVFLYHAYNFAISEVTDFKINAVERNFTYDGIFYLERDDYKKWCKQNHIDTDKLKEITFDFLSKKYPIKTNGSWGKVFETYNTEILKKDHKKEKDIDDKIKNIPIKEKNKELNILIIILIVLCFLIGFFTYSN